MSRRYQDAAARLQQNVEQHLRELKEYSSSEEDEPVDESVLETVLQSYHRGGGDTQLLHRTKYLLEETITSRNITCLICIGTVKRADAIWNCRDCYSYFHLLCIQKWSNDSISLRSGENQGPLTVVRSMKIEWCCPKCRHSYTKEEIPRKYYCFCGKLDNPPTHPWLLPHSCGEVCRKQLSTGDNCKHKCLLLCHPGQCPPCPQTINGACHCGNNRRSVRCSAPNWSCGKKCNKLLTCKSHRCEDICHEGECSPCTFTSIQSCNCGSEKVKRPCNDPTWQCQKVCNKPYTCGYHNCTFTCHSGACGDCPNSGVRSCPCGANQKYVQCPDVIETCVSTCGRKREDCTHTCPEKCHKGPCPPCQVLIEKKCQCSSHKRALPCSRDFKCDTKCRGTRPCNKHSCGRKCCNGNCPPCEKSCDKPLHCGRHKCTMICHSGPCYPCPLESKITCRCKQTAVFVPCGRERNVRPPKCNLSCKLKYKCGHKAENEHQCHFGDCPPCKAICDKPYSKCEHKCKALCHVAVAVVFKQVEKPSTPWDIQPPRTRIMNLDCPPCNTIVSLECFGLHEIMAQRCFEARRRPCGRVCGRPLPCGNHDCSLLCHLLAPDEEYPDIPSSCEDCREECLVARPEKCTHKCSLQSCHPGSCPSCEVREKIPCHCGLTQFYFKCKELVSVTEDMLSCKQQCTKNLDCGHRCKNSCHSGPCVGQVCTRKVKSYCECGNLKKDLQCTLVRSGEAKVLCDESCTEKKLAAKIEKEKEEERLKKMEEEKNKRELAEYEWKFGKKRKHKGRTESQIVTKNKAGWLHKFWIPILSFFVIVIAIVGYIFM